MSHYLTLLSVTISEYSLKTYYSKKYVQQLGIATGRHLGMNTDELQ